MVVDGNQLREIFLGQDRENILKGVKKTKLDTDNKLWASIFGGAHSAAVTVDSVTYSPDKKSCVVKKGDAEYIISQGKLSFKQERAESGKDNKYNLTQIVVDENGYTKCNVTSKTLFGVKAQISQVNDSSQADIFLSTVAKNKDWWSNFYLMDMASADEFIKYMQDNIFSHELNGEEIDALERFTVTKGKSYEQFDFTPWRKEQLWEEYKEEFMELAGPMLEEDDFKSMYDALKQFNSEKIKFIVDYVEKNATAEQTASAGLGDNWARLTSDHRVDKSLKR